MTALRLEVVADYIGADLKGDPAYIIEGIADLAEAQKTQISFVTKKAFAKQLNSTSAGAVIIKDFASTCAAPNQLIVDDPYLAYARLSALFETRQIGTQGIHPSAVVDASAVVSSSAIIGPNCVIEADAFIGDDVELKAGVFVGSRSKIAAGTLLHPRVSVYHDVKIGAGCIIQSGAVIGSDGFGFAPTPERWVKIHQLGGVTIGDNVEIGANTAIDRGALKDTMIHDRVIIDNQVHIAHNVVIGAQTAIAGCVGIAGSAVIGERCTMGGFVAINGHITIADDVHLHGGTIVTKSINEAGMYSCGTPTQDVKQWRRNAVRFGQLDDWVGRIKQLEDRVDKLDSTEDT